MKKDRLTRVNELLLREISLAVFRVVREPEVDLSGITITHVITGSDLRTARVLVSVRDAAQRDRALSALQRHRGEIQHELAEHVILKYTPRLHFTSDTSIAEGDRMLRLLSTIDGDAGAAPAEPGSIPPDDGHNE